MVIPEKANDDIDLIRDFLYVIKNNSLLSNCSQAGVGMEAKDVIQTSD